VRGPMGTRCARLANPTWRRAMTCAPRVTDTATPGSSSALRGEAVDALEEAVGVRGGHARLDSTAAPRASLVDLPDPRSIAFW
jgi:hypothetical protein